MAVVHKEREQRNNRYLAMRALVERKNNHARWSNERITTRGVLQVAVQKERERSKNRFLAMRALVERLENPQARPPKP